MIEMIEGLADADTNDLHDLLYETKDYARRIHWWVRLFGVVWTATIVGGVVLVFAAYLAGAGFGH